MASPQLQNGYTKIANEILEALICANFNGTEFAVVVMIIRKTYGFNKKSDKISISQFEKNIGSSRPAICKALKKLVVNKTLLVNKSLLVSEYSLNKDHNEWLVNKTLLVNKTSVTSKQNDILLVNKTIHTKETIQKKRKKEKHTHLEFVKLAQPEHDKLLVKFGAEITQEYILRVNDYIGQKGKDPYESHYFTILNWTRRDGVSKTDTIQRDFNSMGVVQFTSKYGEETAQKYLFNN